MVVENPAEISVRVKEAVEAAKVAGSGTAAAGAEEEGHGRQEQSSGALRRLMVNHNVESG